jgi:hypothetical protein
MFLSRAVPLAAALVVAGCYPTNVLTLDTIPRPATQPDSVRLLGQEPTQPYTVVAMISVGGPNGGVEGLRRRLMKEAARLGGEAVLLDSASLTQVGVGGESGGAALQLTGKVIVFNREARSN